MATTISISETTRDKLKEFGNKSETYDEIINKMYEIASKQILHQFLYEDTEKYIKLEDWEKEIKEKIKNKDDSN